MEGRTLKTIKSHKEKDYNYVYMCRGQNVKCYHHPTSTGYK